MGSAASWRPNATYSSCGSCDCTRPRPRRSLQLLFRCSGTTEISFAFERIFYLETGLRDDYSANGADVAVDVPFPERNVVPRLELEENRVLIELVVLLQRQFLQS